MTINTLQLPQFGFASIRNKQKNSAPLFGNAMKTASEDKFVKNNPIRFGSVGENGERDLTRFEIAEETFVKGIYEMGIALEAKLKQYDDLVKKVQAGEMDVKEIDVDSVIPDLPLDKVKTLVKNYREALKAQGEDDFNLHEDELLKFFKRFIPMMSAFENDEYSEASIAGTRLFVEVLRDRAEASEHTMESLLELSKERLRTGMMEVCGPGPANCPYVSKKAD